MTQLLSDEVWLQAINAVGAEDFDTGLPTYLRGVFIEEYISVAAGSMEVEAISKALEIRTCDIEAHNLVKRSPIRRVSDDKQYAVRRFERGDGGMTVVILS